jgi:hypothetical protein
MPLTVTLLAQDIGAKVKHPLLGVAWRLQGVAQRLQGVARRLQGVA